MVLHAHTFIRVLYSQEEAASLSLVRGDGSVTNERNDGAAQDPEENSHAILTLLLAAAVMYEQEVELQPCFFTHYYYSTAYTINTTTYC